MASRFPAGAYVLPRVGSPTLLFAGSLMFVSLGVLVGMTDSGVGRVLGALTVLVFGVNAAWQASHLRDGPEMAFWTDGIHHRDFGLIPWERVRGVTRRGWLSGVLSIDVDDLPRLARASGRRIRPLDRLRLRMNRDMIVVPLGGRTRGARREIEAALRRWSGRPVPGGR